MNKRKIIFHSPIKYLIIFVLTFVICFVIALIKNFTLIGFVDAFFVSGVVTFVVGLLSLLSYLGAFDTFAYSFSYVKNSYSKSNNKNIDFYNYKQNKILKREKSNFSFTPYLMIGFVFLIISVVLLIVFKNI